MDYEDVTAEFIAADAREIRKGDTIIHGTTDGNVHHVESVTTEVVAKGTEHERTLVVYEARTPKGARITARVIPDLRITIRRFV
jgi:hypothetical protein